MKRVKQRSKSPFFNGLLDGEGGVRKRLAAVAEQIGRVVLGKEDRIRLALACLLAGGHLLIEDMPGIGKTTLAHALARTMGLGFNRVQFTSDLLPGDVLGVAVWAGEAESFVFQPGPIFTHVLLADEINRATPKTQSALLEAMEEGQVSMEGATRALPSPFFVIATQNPGEHSGAFPLPDSQLDRFLMRLALGYPGRENELELYGRGDMRREVAGLAPLLDPDGVLALQAEVAAVHAAGPLKHYVLDLVEATRSSGRFVSGLSPRAGLGLLRAARARAYMSGRNAVLPEDVQAVFPHAAGHRLFGAEDHQPAGEEEMADFLRRVPVP